MNTKRSKYLRDVKDYQMDVVYEWGRWDQDTFRTPRSILKNRNKRWKHRRDASQKSVSFSSPDTSDSPSEISDTGGAESTPNSRSSVSSVFSRDDGVSETSKNDPPLSYFKHPRSAKEKRKKDTEGAGEREAKRYPIRKKTHKK